MNLNFDGTLPIVQPFGKVMEEKGLIKRKDKSYRQISQDWLGPYRDQIDKGRGRHQVPQGRERQ